MRRARRAGRGGAAAALALLLMLLMPAGARAADPTFPPLTGRVVDAAGILSAETKARLDAMLADRERASGDQLVVATVPSLQGDTIEDYGVRLGRAWGIGQKDRNRPHHRDDGPRIERRSRAVPGGGHG